jgi:hypothetical protein
MSHPRLLHLPAPVLLGCLPLSLVSMRSRATASRRRPASPPARHIPRVGPPPPAAPPPGACRRCSPASPRPASGPAPRPDYTRTAPLASSAPRRLLPQTPRASSAPAPRGPEEAAPRRRGRSPCCPRTRTASGPSPSCPPSGIGPRTPSSPHAVPPSSASCSPP